MIDLLAINTKTTYTCGSIGMEFGGMIPNVVHFIILAIQIVVPILLVIFGLLDLAKAVIAQKEDEIKKGQQTLVKRVIAAAIVFFVITIVRMLIQFFTGNDDSIVGCFNCFVNGEVGNNACQPVGGNSQGL